MSTHKLDLLGILCEKSSYLAYTLQNGDYMLEVPNVEDGQGKLNVRVMAYTVRRGEPARLAEGILVCCALLRNESAMCNDW